MPRYGHDMSVATWFIYVQCIDFTVLSSNGWADLLASRVTPFPMVRVLRISLTESLILLALDR